MRGTGLQSILDAEDLDVREVLAYTAYKTRRDKTYARHWPLEHIRRGGIRRQRGTRLYSIQAKEG